MPGIYEAPSQEIISAALRRRISRHLGERDDGHVHGWLAEAVYLERRRFAAMRGRMSDEDKQEQQAIEKAARAVHRDRASQERAIQMLVDRYATEIHNQFSARTYGFATRLLPGALSRLLTTSEPRQMLGGGFDPASRIVVQGPTELLKELGQTHTLVLAPTHVSNLDSPLIGYALHQAGLPPFIYGAGLNLFSNPAMAFFMSRLGAYTVDRRKKHSLYKDVLKGYSVDALTRGCHSLFFPGGTRARSGQVEKKLKKGLLGTAITAWQDGLASGQDQAEILVVPCTLSFTLVLEAETLIEDSLAEQGKSRYIITDDEFSEPRTVASFARKVLGLDSAMYVRFGAPMDLLGNPVDPTGTSLDHRGNAIDRRAYVTDRAGKVVRDGQRDRVYTSQLAEALVGAYHADTVALSTHVAARAAWELLKARHPRLDTYQLMLLSPSERTLARAAVLAVMDHILEALGQLQQAGKVQTAISGGARRGNAEPALAEAMSRFRTFHAQRGLDRKGANQLVLSPRLCLYYGNRLDGFGLGPGMAAAARQALQPAGETP